MNTFPREFTPKPKPAPMQGKRRKQSKPRRKILEAQIEAMVKQIVFWRDGGECVERNVDGGRCGGKMNWGHFIPRSRSKYLKYDLATFVQCDNHNLIHDSKRTGGGDPIFGLWFAKTFGLEALEAMSREQREHLNGKDRTIPELEEMLAHYDELYQNRYYVELDTPSLVKAGYYGKIIQDAYKQAERK